MDYRDTEEEAAFRQRLRAWLKQNAGEVADNDRGDDFKYDVYHGAWHRALYEGGWMGLSWPREYGGQGLSSIYEAILNDEIGAYGAPDVPNIGFMGRAILSFGSEEQKRQYIPGLLEGSAGWCQGFSEPGAGSDLASLRTSAVAKGDEYLINGQKIWTSRAQFADYCLLLARTDKEAPKHKGISCFVLPMKQPGVRVRPIRQITGAEAYCEVFFDDARCPVENRIGPEGGGWGLAMQTVAYERGPADIGFISRYLKTLRQLELDAGALGDQGAEHQVILGRIYVAVETLRLRVLESLARRLDGSKPGPDSSIDKIIMTETEQLLGHVVFDLAAPKSVLGEDPLATYRYLYSRAGSIYGGTSQIQKDIVAHRILGLPA